MSEESQEPSSNHPTMTAEVQDVHSEISGDNSLHADSSIAAEQPSNHPTVTAVVEEVHSEISGDNSLHADSSITAEQPRVHSSNLDHVSSRLHEPTASILNATYKPKPKDEDVGIPTNVKPIDETSNLLRPTAAVISGGWAPEEATQKQAEVRPINQESHLLKPTKALVSSAWTEKPEPTAATAPTKAIDADSHLLKPTASLKSSAWVPKEEEEKEPSQIKPLPADSNLLRPTNALKAAEWVPKSDSPPKNPSPPPIDGNSPLLRPTKATMSGVYKKDDTSSEGSRSPSIGRMSSSSVSEHLLVPTASMKGQMWKKQLSHDTASESSDIPRWQPAMKSKASIGGELPPVRNDLSNVESKLMQPTANVKNAAYKPKEKEEDPAVIHSSPFIVSRGPVDNSSPPPLPRPPTSAYKDVKSKLYEPTTAAVLNVYRAEITDESPVSLAPLPADSNLLKPTAATTAAGWTPRAEESKSPVVTKLSPESSLLRPTAAVKAAGWTPKTEERKQSPITPLNPESNLLRPTKALEESSWVREKQREAEAAPRSALLMSIASNSPLRKLQSTDENADKRESIKSTGSNKSETFADASEGA